MTPETQAMMQRFENRFCTCGAGHGSGEPHTDWCHWNELAKVCAALESANEMCRSAMAVAERAGTSTNWEPFKRKLAKSLKLQHSVMYPEQSR